MYLGEFITKYRVEHDLSMRDFSRLSGISTPYISSLEKNMTPRGNVPIPTIATVRAVAKAIGMTAEEIVRQLEGNVILSEDPEKEDEEIPEVTMIARAGQRVTPERRKEMLAVLRIAFPEAFDDK